MLCPTCTNFFQSPPRINYSADQDVDDEEEEEESYLHHSSADDLRAAAEELQCHFCTMIWANMSADDPNSAKAYHSKREVRTLETTSPQEEKKQVHVSIFTQWGKLWLRVRFGPARDDEYDSNSWVEVFQILPTQQSSCDGTGILDLVGVGHGPLSTTTAADECFVLAKSWFDICVREHGDRCNFHARPFQGHSEKDMKTPWLPTRLIDVRHSNKAGEVVPRLHLITEEDRTDSTSQYLTLSHCWGTSPRLVLTADTFAELRDGVSLSRLPKTFTDAITITRRLRACYLWIDCLCIFQDSVSDWARESSMMADIYTHALCNIAAAASADSHGGCFVQRNPLEARPLRFEYNPFAPEGSTRPAAQPICIFREPIAYTWHRLDGPLDRRAWVLQEQLLAPRTLHYAAQQLFWECKSQLACEAWPRGIPKSPDKKQELLDFDESGSKTIFDRHMLTVSEKTEGWSSGGPELLYRRWDEVVNRYTLRALTYGRDKLVALSGVAKVMSHQLGGDNDKNTYLAGLWKHNLLRGLMWHVFFAGRKDKRPSEYRAPSWSWASVNGPIEYDLYLTRTRDQDLIPEAEILGAEATLENGDPFGRVSSGRLTLRGPFKEMAWIHNPDSSKPLSKDRVAQTLAERDDLGIVRIHVDTNLDLPDRTIYCLRLFRTKARQDQPESVYGLILHPAGPDREEYVRVGCFRAEDRKDSSHDKAWADFGDEFSVQQVTII